MKVYFVTGTDTSVGKTVLSALMLRHYQLLFPGKVLYIKPFQTGTATLQSDAAYVARVVTKPPAAKLDASKHFLTLQGYSLAAAPHLAAAADGKPLDKATITATINQILAAITTFTAASSPQQDNFIVIEGVGGLYVPLTNVVSAPKHGARGKLPAGAAEGAFMLIDFLAQLYAAMHRSTSIKLNLVLVARAALGTLNHTLLSYEALKNRELPSAVVFLNNYFAAASEQENADTRDIATIVNDNHDFLRQTLGSNVFSFKNTLPPAAMTWLMKNY